MSMLLNTGSGCSDSIFKSIGPEGSLDPKFGSLDNPAQNIPILGLL